MSADKSFFILRNLTMLYTENESDLPQKIAGLFSLGKDEISGLRILRKGIDARKKPRIKYVYTVEFTVSDPDRFWQLHATTADLEISLKTSMPKPERLDCQSRVVIVGSGPAGLFAALRLVEYGIKPLLLERGKPVEERVHDVNRFWNEGILDEGSNVQFGEGGAGTFSDGKLTTRVKDPHCGYVLKRLVEFGAPEEIAWLAKPHVGTDRLRAVLINIRRYLLESGADIRFRAKLSGLGLAGQQLSSVIINDQNEELCDALILAPGHSARDTYAMLHSLGAAMEQKAFAVGFRVEHPQELINRIQYGIAADPRLPAADYALTWNDPATGRAAYSFCMCPGGVVIGGSSETGTVVTNGMSDLKRASGWANSALVATVRTDDFADLSPLAGVEFQRDLEKLAFKVGGGDYLAPAQNLLTFMKLKGNSGIRSSFLPGVREAELEGLLPGFLAKTIKDAITAFERKMRGFITAEATLVGVESRTSAPLRILRGTDFQSPSIKGLYPCGEGAGYAGGIMSAALDGIRVADAVAEKLNHK
ncbi:MAG: hypothetical protein CVU66_00835 [Deltaproteobacteria bacterium HGW-Deltaproteobacteria-23]|nr:MAG: hypothetical protein CVU66_00835 [Deltaproteobacteria bacterium HGW-Deltaproteobacteria-23]